MIQTFPNDFRKRRKDAGAVAATQKTNSSFKLGSKDDFAMFVDVFANAVARALPKQKADYMSPMSLAPGVSPTVTKLAQERMAARATNQNQQEALELDKKQLEYQNQLQQQQLQLQKQQMDLEELKSLVSMRHTEAATKGQMLDNEFSEATANDRASVAKSNAVVANVAANNAETDKILEQASNIFGMRITAENLKYLQETLESRVREAKNAATLSGQNVERGEIDLKYADEVAAANAINDRTNAQINVDTAGYRIRQAQQAVLSQEQEYEQSKKLFPGALDEQKLSNQSRIPDAVKGQAITDGGGDLKALVEVESLLFGTKQAPTFRDEQKKVFSDAADMTAISAALASFGQKPSAIVFDEVTGKPDPIATWNAFPDKAKQLVPAPTFYDAVNKAKITALRNAATGSLPQVDAPTPSVLGDGMYYNTGKFELPVVGTSFNMEGGKGTLDLIDAIRTSATQAAILPGLGGVPAGIVYLDAQGIPQPVFNRTVTNKVMNGQPVNYTMVSAFHTNEEMADAYRAYRESVILPYVERQKAIEQAALEASKTMRLPDVKR